MHGNIDILLHPKGATPLANSAEPGEEDAAPFKSGSWLPQVFGLLPGPLVLDATCLAVPRVSSLLQ